MQTPLRTPAPIGRSLRTRSPFLLVLGCALALGTSACREPAGPLTPELAIERIVDWAERAAEEKDIAVLVNFIDDAYHDARDYDKEKMAWILRYHFSRSSEVHVLVGPTTLRTEGPDRVHAEIVIAVAGTPIDSTASLARTRADLLRFDADFVRIAKDDWKLRWSAWRRATLDDFLIISG